MEGLDPAAIRQRVFQIKRLAAMPQVVWQLLQALEDERTSASTLGYIIGNDMALASKVLSLANSAYYSQSRKVTTIERAAMVIGFEELHLLVMGSALADLFDLKNLASGLDGIGLWIHCLGTSWVARELARAARRPAPNESMVGGLLHDLGKLVLASHFKPEYAELLKMVEQGTPYYQAEEKTGLRHPMVGSWLANRWGLPEVHQAIIRSHHGPAVTDPHYESIAVVFLANRLVKSLRVGLVHEDRAADVSAAMDALKISRATLRDESRKAGEQIPGLVEGWRRFLQ